MRQNQKSRLLATWGLFGVLGCAILDRDGIAQDEKRVSPFETNATDSQPTKKVDDETGTEGETAAKPKRLRKPELSLSELKEQVQKLSLLLDADTASERDVAEAKLQELGSAAIEFFPTVNEDASPEWQMRMDRIRRIIEEQEFKQFTLPTTVTLSGTMTALQALTAISEQTDNPIMLANIPGLGRDVLTEFIDTPFWEAIDEILDQLDMTIAAGNGESIRLVPRSPSAPLRTASASYSGVFRIETISIDKILSLYRPEESNCRVHISLAWEPRLRPVFIRFLLQDIDMICDDGQILSAIADQPTDFLPSDGSQLQVALEFNLPSRQAKRILRWKGEIAVAIPGKPLTLEFSGLEKASNTKLEARDLCVVLEKARKNTDIYEVLVGVSLQHAGESSEAFRGWASTHEAFLVDSNGNRLDNSGWSTTRRNSNGIGFSYLFDVEDGLDDYTFHYRAPGSLIEQTIEYTIEDIPLP